MKSICKVLLASAQEVAVHFFTQKIKSCKVRSAWINSRGHHEVSVTSLWHIQVAIAQGNVILKLELQP